MENETRISYEGAKPVINLALARFKRKGREISDFVETPEFQNLFIPKVDNPVGYEDGASHSQYLLINENYQKLSGEQKKYLFDLGTILIHEFRNSNGSLSTEDKKRFLMTANQIIQHQKIPNHRFSKEGRKAEKFAKRISRFYVGNNDFSIPQWDAQIHENKGFWHIERLNLYGQLGPIAGFLPMIAGAIGAKAMGFDEGLEKVFYHGTIPLTIIGFGAFMLDQFILRLAQDVGKSPVYNEGLIKKHYQFSRHPMYGTRMVGSLALNLATMNPVGLFCAAKALYHGTRGCEEQDKRLQILYGDEARNLQDKVPAYIPGTKLLTGGLRKILPTKIINAPETPISKYLSKIPYVASEPEINEITDARGPNAYLK